MQHPLEPLNPTAILNILGDLRLQIADLEILPSIDSTNAYLLNKTNAPSGTVCLAEEQTSGRGRRGRSWFSPASCNLNLSLLWHFPSENCNLQGLSLVVGIAVIAALQTYGVNDAKLKWPNDVFHHGRKLCGILVEIKKTLDNNFAIVIGVGLNVQLPEQAQQIIEQPYTDIFKITREIPNRNQIAGLILRELLTALPLFMEQGFAAFTENWRAIDALYQQPINILNQDGDLAGIAMGVDQHGNLLVQGRDQLYSFHSGEVSIRVARS